MPFHTSWESPYEIVFLKLAKSGLIKTSKEMTDLTHLKRDILMKYNALLMHQYRTLETIKMEKERYEKLLQEKPNFIFDQLLNDYYVETCLNFDCFVYLVRSFLDLTAKLTRFLFRGANRPKSRSFREQKKKFREDKKLDKDYSTYLEEKTLWIDSLNDIRDFDAHFGSPFIGYDEKHNATFSALESLRNEKGATGHQSIDQYITNTMSGLSDFIAFYTSHFGN